MVRAADLLDSLEFTVLELLALEQADQMPVARRHVDEALAGRVPQRTLDRRWPGCAPSRWCGATTSTCASSAPRWETIPWRVGRINAEPDD